MNSKQALEKLFDSVGCEFCINWDKCNPNSKIKECEKLKKCIENDLEILELQRMLQKKTIQVIRDEGMEEMELPKAKDSFDALEYLLKMSNKYQMIRYPGVSNLTIGGYYEQVQKDLERLEELEERYKHRSEIANELNEELKKYQKAFDILNEKMNLAVYHNKTYNIYSVDLLKLNNDFYVSKEQYNLLKEVLEDD